MKWFQGFLERADCFIQQYTNYTVPELEDVLGEDAHVSLCMYIKQCILYKYNEY